MAKRTINRFYEVYLQIATNNPSMLLKDCYEMAEKWHKWKFGKRRYKSIEVFKSANWQRLNNKNK